MTKPIYVLGTGLSHNGSSVLLKDGKVHTAIEKERLTRKKHDGGNDTLTIEYCLNAAGISLEDVDLVVQCANFEYPGRNTYRGERPFKYFPDLPVIDISHHLAHAYSAAGTCPFEESYILVMDGCGSPYQQVIDNQQEATLNPNIDELIASNFVCEKDSFYYFDGSGVKPLIKDFSESDLERKMPITKHSIGGFYSAVSQHVFGDMDDVGKLMGLAPFGDANKYSHQAFLFDDQQLKMHPQWHEILTSPSSGYTHFTENFAYYADIAAWAQTQVTSAVTQLVSKRMAGASCKKLSYSGGVALNIVANTRLITEGIVDELYVEPAAADNGLALGCAYYGWLETLKKPRVMHDSGTCFGRSYGKNDVVSALNAIDLSQYKVTEINDEDELVQDCAVLLASGKIVAWFQGGSEFGPRALGHRSILAHPGIEHLHQKINQDVKNREDFRPFAPAVLAEDAAEYFESGASSPYMLAIDKTRAKYLSALCNTTHQDKTARLQTVEREKDPRFAALLAAFKQITGLSVLLNTSLNRRGQPMVETPKEAVALFQSSALDALVIESVLIIK